MALDANILIDAATPGAAAAERRNAALRLFGVPASWTLSALVIVEAMPLRIADGSPMLGPLVELLERSHVVAPSRELLQRAFDTAAAHGLGGLDAVVFASAREVDADLLVTRDRALLAAGGGWAVTPARATRQLLAQAGGAH